MGLRKHIRQIDFIKIKKAVADGHDCQVISQSLRLDYDRVADIITSLPKGEKAEFEAKERHKVRVAKSNDEDYTPKKYKAKKTKTPIGEWSFFLFVGVVRFELTTPCSQSRCANRTALHPEKAVQKYEFFFKIQCESG